MTLATQVPITSRKYYAMALLPLFLFLILSQKPNFSLTLLGLIISIMIFTFVFFFREKQYRAQIATLADTSTSLTYEAAYAKFDKNFNLTYVSKDFTQILGIEQGNLLEILKNCSIKEGQLQQIKESVKKNHAFNSMIEVKIGGTLHYIDTFIHKIGNHFNTAEYIIRCSDISSYIHSKEKLKNQLFLDDFTKLPTRLQLLDDIKHNKEKTHPQSLFYIQVVNYEEINELFGIDVGNKLLLQIAKWLEGNLPTNQSKLYKFEHNNFVMYSPSHINLIALEEFLKQLHNQINNTHFTVQEIAHDISLTIGASRGKKNLLKHAYLALKDAQKNNKYYKIFNKRDANEAKFLNNIQTNKKIKSALKEDRIVPFFQPILNIQTNEVEKFESLMRIQNSDDSHLSPAEFLDVAKQSNLYSKLTKAMVHASLSRLEYLQYPITINISTIDILNPKVANFILRKLDNCPQAELITFEILETDEIQSYTRVTNFIKKIKALKCKVAIDDFGSGYSNFEQVLKLDIDYIKIDGSLIKDIDKNKESEIITKTIISFAKELGIKTIAEFVSSESIFDKVKLLGVDYAQGYYIGKPAPLAASKLSVS